MISFLLALCSLSPAVGSVEKYVEEERVYREFQVALKEGVPFRIAVRAPVEQKLALDAIEDAGLSPEPWISAAEAERLAPRERLRWLRLRDGFVPEFAERKLEFVSPSVAEVRDLFESKPASIREYEGGRFASVPRLFMFCRNDRRYPCLFVLRDRNDNPVRVNGILWTQPALGLSWDNRPYHQRGGHTPQGVYHVEGVMPEADDPEGFGRFRRLILDFSPPSAGEREQMKLLPASAHSASWWREAVVARDNGRNLLRIHGTGERSEATNAPYHPFVPTAGCVAQRELEYGGVDYIDQRRLLDRWMAASGLPLEHENEIRIRGLFYVMNIDDGTAPVSAADLARYGIR